MLKEEITINFTTNLLTYLQKKEYSIYRKYMEVVNVAIATNILQCLIPISQFNKGQASKIFDRLHDEKELENAEDIDIE